MICFILPTHTTSDTTNEIKCVIIKITVIITCIIYINMIIIIIIITRLLNKCFNL